MFDFFLSIDANTSSSTLCKSSSMVTLPQITVDGSGVPVRA